MKNLTAIVFFAFLIISSAVSESNFDCDSFAKTFIDAIKNEKSDDLHALLPSEELLRKNFPDEAKELPEGDSFLNIIKDKIDQDFLQIIESKKNHNIDPEKFTSIACKIEKPYGEEHPMKALAIHYEYEEHSGEFALGLVELDGKYYLQGILLSHDIFNFEN
jgi:hypothetical protein